MSNSPSNTELEKGLQYIFPGPDAAFVDRLESRLMQRAADVRRQPAPRTRWMPQPFHLRGWMAAVALAVGVFVVMAVIGPQNVLAAVQKLLGYIPGIGFVENSQQPLRVLAAPVEEKRDGVTVTVEKALASDKSTLVRIRVDGLPQDKSLFERGWGETAQPMLREVIPNAASSEGKTLTASGSLSGAGDFVWAEYSFPPLSAGVNKVTLLLAQLPGLKAGAAPEKWAIDLPLREVQPGIGLAVSTGEPRASQQISGARLVLESIASTQEQTALKLRLETGDPLRAADSEWWKGLVLTDDQGQALPLNHEQALSGLRDGSVVMLAPPLDPSRRYTLRLEQSGFEYRFNAFERVPGFRLAVPAGVQPGQAWPVDKTLEVGDYRLHVTQASVQAGTMGGVVLSLTIDPQPGLIGVGLRCRDLQVCSGSGFELAQPDQPLRTDVYFAQPLGRSVDLQLQMLLETASGLWEVEFQLDGGQ